MACNPYRASRRFELFLGLGVLDHHNPKRLETIYPDNSDQTIATIIYVWGPDKNLLDTRIEKTLTD